MKKRITCITLLDEESLDKIENTLSNLKEKYNLCKVPFLKEPYEVSNREEADTLPYHFTLSFWDEDNREEAIQIFEKICMKKVEVLIEDVKIKKGRYEGFNLFFSFKASKELKEIQEQIYKCTKNEKFNPNTYLSHISIHSDKDYNKLIKMKEIIMETFEPFTVSFEKLGLFEIYPAKRIM